MSLSLLELNDAYPPIWLQDFSSGKTLRSQTVAVGGELNPAITPATEGNSALRRTDGQDFNNYMIRQRIEGDLFHRDLVLSTYLNDLLNLLAQRSGLVYNIPTTIIAPDKYIVISHLGGIQTAALKYSGLFVSAARCVKKTDSGSCGIRIVAGDTVVYTAPVAISTSSTSMFTTSTFAYLNRGFQLTAANTGGANMRIELYNESLTNSAEVSGFVSLVANTV
jgi:hypothetical protein